MNILITGASRGLGKAMAEILLTRGHNVLTPCRAALDVSSLRSIQEYASFVRNSGLKLHVLINNAAVIDAMPIAMETNAMGPWRLSEYLWPILCQSSGRIINISSREGLPTNNGWRPYSVSKAALNAITRMHAASGEPVTVTACCPGWFRSGCGGDKAPISATEAADTPIWLATEATDCNGKFYINREVVPW